MKAPVSEICEESSLKMVDEISLVKRFERELQESLAKTRNLKRLIQ